MNAFSRLQRLPSLSNLTDDLRGAARSVARQPAHALAAVLTFAVAIGATVGLFSVVDPLLMKPLPVPDAAGLVRLHDDGRETFTYPDFERVRDGTTAFSGLAAAMRVGASRRASIDGVDVAVASQEVSGEYFDVLGIGAALGRVFAAGAPGADGPVAVISDAFRRRQFREDRGVIGARIRYAGTDFTVIGVAPSGFGGLNLDRPADLWVPMEQALPPDSMLRTRGRFIQVVGRLRPGVDSALAADQASRALGRPVQVEPGTTGFSALRDRFGGPLLVLQLGVAAILLIGSANVANLTLLRGASRARELATRAALGASRGRIVRQLVAESCVLGAAGAVLAVGLAYWVNRALLSFLPPEDLPAAATLGFTLDARMLFVLAAALAVSVVIAGVLPAISVSADTSLAELRGATSTAPGTRRRSRRVLAVAQVALSTFLVIGAAMFVRTVVNLWSIDAGFETRDVLMADLVPPDGAPAAPSHAAYEEARARLASMPGVESAALSSMGQMTGYGIESPVYTASVGDAEATSFELSVSPGFFAAMGIRLMGGRDFSEADRDDAAPVAIVNAAFARRFLGLGPAVGRRFATTPDAGETLEIVGVVEDSKWLDLREEAAAMYYRPLRQRPSPSAVLVVHAPGRLAAAERAVDDVRRALEGRLDVTGVVPFATVVGRTLATERMLAQISSALGALALAVVAVGLYGLLAFEVAARTREFGIRLALGSSNARISRSVVRDTLSMLALGVPIGIAAALSGTRAVDAMLFGVASVDPWSLASGIGALAAVALIATWLPVRRISSIEPSALLRSE